MDLSPDTQAVLLLCGELGQRGEVGPKPLGTRHYGALALWLKAEQMRPGDLLGAEGCAKLAGLNIPGIAVERVDALLKRGGALALMTERWERIGLWVISRSDARFPKRLKKYLGQMAPALLYGVGPMELADKGGLAVVGSRDRSEEDGEFARRAGEQCAREGIAIISGAAKGIDRDAMTGSLEAGGTALGVLAEGLTKYAVSSEFRSDLTDGRLTLLSPYDPDARWQSWMAMDRNRILYGICDAALVVASTLDKGGTWAGATEALDQGRTKVFVKAAGKMAPGNPVLLRMGAVAFPEEPWSGFRPLLESRPESEPVLQFGQNAGVEAAPTAYTLLLSEILKLLHEPRDPKWLSERMGVRVVQMKDWLDQAVKEGQISTVKVKTSTRYLAAAETASETLPLFAQL